MIRVLVVATLAILLPNAVLAGDYELIVKTARIASKKSNGQGWDAFGNAPDPYVLVGVRDPRSKDKYGDVVKTSHKNDTYNPDWNETVLEVNLDDDLDIEVMDKDISANDFVGSYQLTVTAKTIRDGELRLKFDQVEELRIVIRKR